MSETVTTPETPTATEADGVETFSKEYVKELRDEAAATRVSKKEAVETAQAETRASVVGEYEPQLAERDTKISGLEAQVASQGIEILKLKAAITANVPTEDLITVSELVQGSDEETISASVKRVMSIYGKTPKNDIPTDPSQGHGNGNVPLNGDPVEALLRRAVGAPRK